MKKISLRFFLVDDNTELLSMLEDIFLPMYNVYTACNGREGLEMAQQIQPDLIVSDVIMPEMSGKDLCYKNQDQCRTFSYFCRSVDSTDFCGICCRRFDVRSG